MGSPYIGESASTQNVIELMEAGLATQTPAILWGPPGVGKTALVRALAARHNLPLFILLASTMDPTDINGLPALREVTIEKTDESGERIRTTVTEPTLQYWSEALIREGQGILFFDEASTATPAVQATLLSVLQGRIVGRHTLPDSVWMLAAANAANEAADGWELAPPMANRFLHIQYKPSFEDWCEGMSVAWGAQGDAPKKDETEESIKRLQLERAKVVQFLKQHPAIWNDMPKDTVSQGGAWPSPRSWDATAKMLSKLDKKATRNMSVLGLVGEAASIQFEKFEAGLKLPPYEGIINAPASVRWKTMSAAEVRIILDIVLSRMNEDNIKQTLNVFQVVGSPVGSRPDIAASLAFPLMNKLKVFIRAGKATPVDILPLIKEYTPFLNEAEIQ